MWRNFVFPVQFLCEMFLEINKKYYFANSSKIITNLKKCNIYFFMFIGNWQYLEIIRKNLSRTFSEISYQKFP